MTDELPPEKVEVILAWSVDGGCTTIRTGKLAWKPWDGNEPIFLMEIDYGDAATSIYTKREDAPTHWQPLPEPPNA